MKQRESQYSLYFPGRYILSHCRFCQVFCVKENTKKLYTKAISGFLVFVHPHYDGNLTAKGIDWFRIVPLIGRLHRETALFESEVRSIENPDVVLHPLALLEASASCAIEGIQATLAEALEFEAGRSFQKEPLTAIRRVVRCRDAILLSHKKAESGSISRNVIRELHRALFAKMKRYKKERGVFRQGSRELKQYPDIGPRRLPPWPVLKNQLRIWETVFNRDHVEAFVQLCVLHGQFEMLHPFAMGNGGIARMLAPVFLFRQGLISAPVFYISDWILSCRDEYAKHLKKLGPVASWTPWIELFLTGLIAQARRNTDRVHKLRRLYEDTKLRIHDLSRSNIRGTILDRLFCRPVFSTSQLIALPEAPSKPAVLELLWKLESDGILSVVQEGSGRRPTMLAFSPLIDILEAD